MKVFISDNQPNHHHHHHQHRVGPLLEEFISYDD